MERSQRNPPSAPPRRAQLVDVDLTQLTRRRIRKSTALRAKALRMLAGFLLLMVLFTLLSRAADELTIARVSAGEAQRRTIDRKVTASGKVEENSARALATVSGIRVAGLSVKAGGKVEEGAPLFTLDQEDLKEKLEDARQELEKLDLDIQDQKSREALDSQDRATALARARQDYADAKKAADQEVDRAAKALEEARRRLNSYAPPPAPDLSALQAACGAKAKALEEAQAALEGLSEEIVRKVSDARAAASETGEDPDAAEAAVRAEYQAALDAANADTAAAQEEKQAADDALAAAQHGSGESQEPALQDAVDAAQQAYDQAETARDSALKSAARAIEDAQKGTASDSSGEKAQMARDAQAEQVKKLEDLLNDGGVVRAPAAGTVTKLSVEVGSPTPEGTAALLADSSKGTVFTAQIPSDQEKYLAAGDEVVLKPGGAQEAITGLTVESVGKSGQDPDLLDVTVRLPDGALEIGAAASMEATRKSEEYPLCVPLSALHEENGSYYLLVPQENQTILGTELAAARLDVTVLEKNESYAALAEGALLPGQKFLTDPNKPVGAGDRVRLEQQ